MISLDKRLNKALWHINASFELFSRLSNQLAKFERSEMSHISYEIMSKLKSSYKKAKSLFIEGRKCFNDVYFSSKESFASINIINRKYFERSIIYLVDFNNIFTSINGNIQNKGVMIDIVNDLKILIFQIKSVANLLR